MRVLQVAANAFGNQRRAQVRRVKNFLSTEPRAAIDIAVVRFSGASRSLSSMANGKRRNGVLSGSQPLMHANGCCAWRECRSLPRFVSARPAAAFHWRSRWPAGWFHSALPLMVSSTMKFILGVNHAATGDMRFKHRFSFSVIRPVGRRWPVRRGYSRPWRSGSAAQGGGKPTWAVIRRTWRLRPS